MYELTQISQPKSGIFVIFGATGDLTHRKLLPALFKLYKKNKLPDNYVIVAVARRDKTHEVYREDARESLRKFMGSTNNDFLSKIFYFKTDFNTSLGYQELDVFLSDLDINHGTNGNRIFYLATLPNHFEPIVKNIKKYNLIKRHKNYEYKLIIEKPFGNDLASAKKLNNILLHVFRETEILRIDHYLGKETVQNLFVLRFANRMFEPLWNHEHIQNIQITVAEDLGVETRGRYYDNYGALRDMIQNHLLQLLTLVAMDCPQTFTATDIKSEKVKILKAIKMMSKSDMKNKIIFGQYVQNSNDKDYIDEDGVDKNSRTETYVALQLNVENKRWKNTPFYLRTGKHLKAKATEIVVYFKPSSTPFTQEDIKQNVLVLKLQPDEGIYLRFNAKKPGNSFDIDRVSMDFCHSCMFDINTPEAYETLLFNAFSGDLSLFSRWDEVEHSWKIIDPITKYWIKSTQKPIYYKSKSWGPVEADELLEKNGHHWRLRADKT